MSLPSLAEVEHADWPTLERLAAALGLNPKGRSSVVRQRVLDHVRERVRPEIWRPGPQQQAALLVRLGHPDTAARLWESTIRLDAPSPWVGLGRAQLGAGDLKEAAKSFDRAAQMGEAAAYLHLAEALAAAGDYEAAVRSCDAFLAARPRDLRGALLKANFLARGGWSGEAATILRDAFEFRPEVRELWKGLGALLLRSGRADAAAEAYREAVRASPEDLGVWINRGAALLLEGQIRDAVGAFREVLEKDPHQAIALNNLGIAYLRQGREKPAAVTLERAAKHLETPVILRNLASLQPPPPRRRPARAPRVRPRSVRPQRAPRAPRRRRAPRKPAHRARPSRPKKPKRATRKRRPTRRPRKPPTAPRRPRPRRARKPSRPHRAPKLRSRGSRRR